MYNLSATIILVMFPILSAIVGGMFAYAVSENALTVMMGVLFGGGLGLLVAALIVFLNR